MASVTWRNQQLPGATLTDVREIPKIGTRKVVRRRKKDKKQTGPGKRRPVAKIVDRLAQARALEDMAERALRNGKPELAKRLRDHASIRREMAKMAKMAPPSSYTWGVTYMTPSRWLGHADQ